MKKVLLFLDYYHKGGIEKVIETIVESLEEKYEFHLLSMVNPTKEIESLLAKNYRNFMIRNFHGIWQLKKYLKNKNITYDIVHIHGYNSFLFVYGKVFQQYSKRIILHAHNSSIDYDRFRIKFMINEYLKRRNQDHDYQLVSCSVGASQFCFGKDSLIIENGVDYQKYAFSKEYRDYYRKKYHLESYCVIAQIGRLEKQKNPEFTLSVFQKLLEKNKKYYLIFVGIGSKKEELLNQIKNLHMKDSVLLLDYQKDLNQMMSAFDIVVQPSLYEGFGLSCVESQVNERIVLLSDNFSSEMVISNNAYQLPLEVEQWVEMIDQVKKKNSNISNQYDIQKFIQKIEALYS